jgi:hypothetical protein
MAMPFLFCRGHILHRCVAGFGHVEHLDQDCIGALLHRFLHQFLLPELASLGCGPIQMISMRYGMLEK